MSDKKTKLAQGDDRSQKAVRVAALVGRNVL
jgi:hypothetical protein